MSSSSESWARLNFSPDPSVLAAPRVIQVNKGDAGFSHSVKVGLIVALIAVYQIVSCSVLFELHVLYLDALWIVSEWLIHKCQLSYSLPVFALSHRSNTCNNMPWWYLKLVLALRDNWCQILSFWALRALKPFTAMVHSHRSRDYTGVYRICLTYISGCLCRDNLNLYYPY